MRGIKCQTPPTSHVRKITSRPGINILMAPSHSPIQIICPQLYRIKYSYVTQLIFTLLYAIQYSNPVQIICTQVYCIKYSYVIQIIFTLLYGIKYSNPIQIICLQWYCIKNSYVIQIIFTLLYGIKYSIPIQIICFQLYGINYSFFIWIVFKQICSTHGWHPNMYYPSVRVNRREIAMKGCSTLPRSPGFESHRQMQFSFIPRPEKMNSGPCNLLWNDSTYRWDFPIKISRLRSKLLLISVCFENRRFSTVKSFWHDAQNTETGCNTRLHMFRRYFCLLPRSI